MELSRQGGSCARSSTIAIGAAVSAGSTTIAGARDGKHKGSALGSTSVNVSSDRAWA